MEDCTAHIVSASSSPGIPKHEPVPVPPPLKHKMFAFASPLDPPSARRSHRPGRLEILAALLSVIKSVRFSSIQVRFCRKCACSTECVTILRYMCVFNYCVCVVCVFAPYGMASILVKGYRKTSGGNVCTPFAKEASVLYNSSEVTIRNHYFKSQMAGSQSDCI
ncbi:hypothetical protein P692DRAFT_20499919 [Suillus brevipes Sb2]|nr:hypothetical protein P692DRAFT_20499919 [Suillus brevipes Sb2]